MPTSFSLLPHTIPPISSATLFNNCSYDHMTMRDCVLSHSVNLRDRQGPECDGERTALDSIGASPRNGYNTALAFTTETRESTPRQ